MRIVIDLQGAQGNSRYRGLGRFSLSFAKALAANSKNHDIHLALNGSFQDSIDDIRCQFETIIPQSNIHVWYPLSQTSYMLNDPKRREISEEIYKSFIKNLRPDALIVTSFFEGFSDSCTFGIDDKSIYQTFVVLHDIISHAGIYFENKTYEKFYRRKVEDLKRFNFFLSFSDHNVKYIQKYLGINGVFNARDSVTIDFSKNENNNKEYDEINDYSWINISKNILDFIENKRRIKKTCKHNVFESISDILSDQKDIESLLVESSVCINKSLQKNEKKTIFYDVSEIVQNDAKTGIQRVVRSILLALLEKNPNLYNVEPVYSISKNEGYRCAKKFKTSNLPKISPLLEDDLINFNPGDIFLAVDLYPKTRHKEKYLMMLKNHGVKIVFFLHDILPIKMPNYFVEASEFDAWLKFILKVSDQIICNSKTTENDINNWLLENKIERRRPLKITHINLGSDIENSIPTTGFDASAGLVFKTLANKINFLMVGTIEPRKGYHQVLKAFDELWQRGFDVNFIIVGKKGWKMEDFPNLLNNHIQFNKKLFWLSGISDEYLTKLYSYSTCLIAASEGEGYGLPIIEAAKHGLPIIARNIPVFKEISQSHAFFFDGLEPEKLSLKIEEWIDLYKKNEHPLSNNIELITWKQSADQLLEVIFPT